MCPLDIPEVPMFIHKNKKMKPFKDVLKGLVVYYVDKEVKYTLTLSRKSMCEFSLWTGEGGNNFTLSSQFTSENTAIDSLPHLRHHTDPRNDMHVQKRGE